MGRGKKKRNWKRRGEIILGRGSLKSSVILGTGIALRRKYLAERRTDTSVKRGTIPEKGSTLRKENTPKREINQEGGTIQRKREITHEVEITLRRANLTEVQKSPRSDRLSRIEADLKRGALSEWDLKRVTGGFEAKKWSWQKKKEEEMKAFLKYENLCNREKKSIAAKFAERDRLWLEEREKEREERRKEREKEKAPRRERTQSGGEKSKRERSYSRGEEKSKHREGSGKRSESSKYREDKVEKEERTVRRADEEPRGHKKRNEEERRERKLSKREEDEEVYGPKEPPSEERSHASRKTEERSRPRKKSEERISKTGHRSSSSKGIKEKEHSG